MSWSLRSRNSSTSAVARTFSTAPGPSWQNSCRPTLTARTVVATAAVHAVATPTSDVSRATAIGARGAVIGVLSLGVFEGDGPRHRLRDQGFVTGRVGLVGDDEG